ncbi:MAG: fluoride efflux transporter CrcB [Candidatus Brocadiae bacterium]|nr:fluoride efflux transporter CrcB [Candidatus Brocadiia bacterium]
MARTCLLLALAGAAGTLARWGLGAAVTAIRPGSFPWATLAVNALGCLLFGVVTAFADARGSLSAEMRGVLTTGFLGAFTTFSTFASETVHLHRDGRGGAALLNVAAQVFLGLAFAFLGDRLVRQGA